MKSFVYIEFEELGSTNYSINAENVTPAQMFVISKILELEGTQGYMAEKIEATRKLARPTEGIIKP